MLLIEKNCSPVIAGTPLTEQQANALLSQLQLAWQFENNYQNLVFDFMFTNFHETMNFVNAMAWVIHQQDHHPDLEIGYNHCRVSYTTHSVGGLTENDFICAARIEHLLT